MKTSSVVKVAVAFLLSFLTFQVISSIFENSRVPAGLPSFLTRQHQEYKHQHIPNMHHPLQHIFSNSLKVKSNPQNPEISLPFFVAKTNRIMKYKNKDNNELKEARFNIKADDSNSKKLVINWILKQNNTLDDIGEGNARTQIKRISEKLLSSGFGLQPLKTNSSLHQHDAWIENGVIYRPIKIDNSPRIKEKHPSPRLTNYEAFIPFNETLFFKHPIIKKAQHVKDNFDTYYTTRKKKIILWYTPARYTPPSSTPQPLRFCPDLPCLMTTNQQYLNESALVVFNGQQVGSKPPRRAFDDQVFMFHNQEPPLDRFFQDHVKFKQPNWAGVFNWTMTYRTDSTIPSYYGIVRKHPNPPKKNYLQILSQKNRTVAWMVSHCGSPSKRDEYVRELKKYIDVDVYGSCGTYKCDRKDDETCNRNIAESYKFYLGFENGFCPDYISEKFFRFMPLDIVTVSRGIKGLHSRHAAPGTYITTSDYSSPKKLAEYLTYLDKNDEEYIKILREKDKYIYLFEDYAIREKDQSIKYIHYHYEAVPFCHACQKLWNLKDNENRIENIHEWFNRKLCEEPNDVVIS